MKLKELFQDDTAVSPVIGVILMVAITVILAAVIATFVLGLGEQVSSTAPSSSFSFDLDAGQNPGLSCGSAQDGELTVRHAGGPTIDGATLSLAGHTGGSTAFNDNSDYSAGNSVTANVCTDDTVDVVWESDGDSAILATYRGPDA